MKIPLIDLTAQFNQIEGEVKKALFEVIQSKKFIHGEFVKEFSKNFLKIHGGNFGVGCSSGTSALVLALRAAGVGRGDEVITTNFTFIATIEAIHQVGAIPVLVDIEPQNYQMDLNQVKAKISKKTKAIIAVHLYGHPTDVFEIKKIINNKNIKIIEDCAQAHLAKINDHAVGTIGDFGTFSFYPGKNLGAYGDAGFVIANNKKDMEFISLYLDHGRKEKYKHNFLGSNYRMDEIQAAILDVKLKYLNKWTQKRISNAKKYTTIFQSHGFKTIKNIETFRNVYHLYTIEASNREEVINFLSKKGISTGTHYPLPLNEQPALKFLNYKKKNFPICRKVSKKILSLPMYPELTDKMIEYVSKNFLKIARP